MTTDQQIDTVIERIEGIENCRFDQLPFGLQDFLLEEALEWERENRQ